MTKGLDEGDVQRLTTLEGDALREVCVGNINVCMVLVIVVLVLYKCVCVCVRRERERERESVLRWTSFSLV